MDRRETKKKEMQINIPLDGANPAMITSEGNAASFLVLEPTKKKKERENLSTGVVPKRPTAGYTIAQKKKSIQPSPELRYGHTGDSLRRKTKRKPGKEKGNGENKTTSIRPLSVIDCYEYKRLSEACREVVDSQGIKRGRNREVITSESSQLVA